MRFKGVLFFLFILIAGNTRAEERIELSYEEFQVIIEFQEQGHIIERDSSSYPVKFKRGKAIAFTILTGFLGGHRIYFGTHHRTPIIYSITFGGLGLLPLIDLAHIIFTKDLSRYEHKSQIIMWGK